MYKRQPYTNLALVQEEMVVVISKQHAWATRRRCQLHELRNQPIAMPNPGHSTLSGYLRGLFAKNPPHIAFWAPSILQMMIFVRNGACTVLPLAPVSYTHLDVYKRQSYASFLCLFYVYPTIILFLA